jgi:hypothetical protein
VGRIWAAHKRGSVHYQEGCGSAWLCVEHSPWEARSYWVSQIPRILWNPKAHFRVHSSPKIGSVQYRSFHPNPLRYILILSSLLRLCRPSDVLLSDFATKPCMSLLPVRATCFAHHILDYRTDMQITKLFITQFSPVSCHSLLLSPKHIPQRAVLHHPQPM